jgi:hypothetical protein
MEQTDYLKYRGKCKEFVDESVRNNHTLTPVRGFYYDYSWGRQAHWWCKRTDGTIYDPTADQFPSKGKGVYEEFDGTVECAQCGKEMPEAEAIIDGNGHYAFCSTHCNMRFVGL